MEGAPKNHEASGEKQPDGVYRKLGELANSDLSRSGENQESKETIEVSDTYKALARKELERLGEWGGNVERMTFEEMEKATGIARLMQIGVDEYTGDEKVDSKKIVEAIVNRAPTPDAVAALEYFHENYGAYETIVNRVLPKIHEEWIKMHERDFITWASGKYTMEKCAQFLPFDRIGYKLMLEYASIIKPIFKGLSESVLEAYYKNLVLEHNVAEDEWPPDYDGGPVNYSTRNAGEVFEVEAGTLYENPSGLYGVYKYGVGGKLILDGMILPEGIENAIRGNERLAQTMVYHYTFGEASYWTDDDRREGFLYMINNK